MRVLKNGTVELMLQNHWKGMGRKYGRNTVVDGDGGYSWGGTDDGTRFWIDRKHKLYAVFMGQTQGCRSPACTDFRRLVNKAVGK